MASLPRTVMITGAAGNLGRAVAAAFAHEGANLVLVDLTRDSLERAFGAEAQTMQFAPTNLLDAAQVQSSVDAALGRFGRIGVLCNLAGGFRMGEPVHQTADSTWDFLLDINARTLLHSARSVVPAMLGHGGGRIVNVAAFAARQGQAQMAAYCVAKDAVVRLTEAMSAELRNKNINVNCVLPTIIDTPENRAAMPDADPTRWVEPQDLARVIHFLASDGARAVHGAALPVTGLS
jgi:NAD(P)-dependent dehydrogenase (short-subunit alcohol dehydrogenase family)